jgi:hypothetical protein
MATQFLPTILKEKLMKKLQKTIVLIASLFGATVTNAATLIHDYQFNGNLNDSRGGAALATKGGVLDAGSYKFGPNQGLVLSSNRMSADSYSIALNFNFSALSGWQKIVDFKDLQSTGTGLYAASDKLNFYMSTNNSSIGLTAKQNADLVLTRDRASNVFTAYLNGVEALSFTDLKRVAVFTGTYPIANFFRDGFGHASGAGVVNSIKVWNGALTKSEVSHLNDVSAVPLPGTVWLLGSALAGLGLLNKRKQA